MKSHILVGHLLYVHFKTGAGTYWLLKFILVSLYVVALALNGKVRRPVGGGAARPMAGVLLELHQAQALDWKKEIRIRQIEGWKWGMLWLITLLLTHLFMLAPSCLLTHSYAFLCTHLFVVHSGTKTINEHHLHG